MVNGVNDCCYAHVVSTPHPHHMTIGTQIASHEGPKFAPQGRMNMNELRSSVHGSASCFMSTLAFPTSLVSWWQIVAIPIWSSSWSPLASVSSRNWELCLPWTFSASLFGWPGFADYFFFNFPWLSPPWLRNLLENSAFPFLGANSRWFSPWSRWSLRTPIGRFGSWSVWASASWLRWLFTLSPSSWPVRAASRTWLLPPTTCESWRGDPVVFFHVFPLHFCQWIQLGTWTYLTWNFGNRFFFNLEARPRIASAQRPVFQRAGATRFWPPTENTSGKIVGKSNARDRTQEPAAYGAPGASFRCEFGCFGR